jgi:hypothetical protein
MKKQNWYLRASHRFVAVKVAAAQESYVQVPPDSTGKKIRHYQATIGGNAVYIPGNFLSSAAGVEIGLVSSPIFVRFTDGAAAYDAAKGSQLPAALVGGRLDVNVGNTVNVAITGTVPLPTGAATETTLAGIKTGTDKIPSSPATDRTTAGAPSSARLSDGSAFIVFPTAAANRWFSQITDGTNNATVTAGGSLNVNCTGGCGGAAGFSDSTAFSFASTTVNPMAAVVDDTSTNTVAENSAGSPRMNTNRILYVDVSKTAANGTAIKVDGSSVTQPVSGTFWQATQPVSGTFWQATQPVSGTVTSNIGTTNGLALDATLTGGTQKAIARGAAKGTTSAADVTSENVDANTQALHVFLKNATIAVTGTFWQATQPVSGTVTSNIGTTNGLALDATLTGGSQKTKIVDSGGTNVATVSAAGAVKVDGSAVTQPVSGAVTSNIGTTNGIALDASVTGLEVAQASTTSGQKGALVQGAVTTAAPTYTTAQTSPLSLTTAGALRVDGSGTTQPVSGTVTTTPPANASTNIAQIGGTTADTNSGTKSAGTLRVVLATDQPQLTNKLLVTPDSVALPANQSVNVSQINAVTPLMGNGATGTGSPRVTVSSDNTPFAVKTDQTTHGTTDLVADDITKIGGTAVVNGGVAGSIASGGVGGNNAAITQNPDLVGVEALSSQPTAATTGNLRRLVGALDGALYVRPNGPVTWSCGLTAIAATLTQCQAAPAAGLKLYITDIQIGSNTATAGLFLVRYGTGSNCVTGTTTLFPNIAAQTTGVMPYPANTAAVTDINFVSPPAGAAANALCVICVATNTCVVNMSGYTAP